MEKVLGVLLLALYIVGIVGLAAAITYAVVRIFPTQRTPSKPDEPSGSSSSPGQESMAGRLFRRAKRAAT